MDDAAVVLTAQQNSCENGKEGVVFPQQGGDSSRSLAGESYWLATWRPIPRESGAATAVSAGRPAHLTSLSSQATRTASMLFISSLDLRGVFF